MDIQAMQSMDWLFKKERIYLLAQFWQQRATLAEKEVAALKEQLAGSPQDSKAATSTATMPAAATARGSSGAAGESEASQATPGQGESGARPGLEQELVAKDKEISQLSEDIARLQTALARAQEGTAAQVARLEEQLEQRSVRIARLEARLDAQRDYEDVKRELSILRAMDLPTFAAAAAAAAAAAQQQQSQSEVASAPTAPSGKALELLNEAAALSVRRSTTPMSEEHNQSGAAAATPTPTSTAAPVQLFPPALQTVETFGSFLGEEIVANWRRSLERTILSQNAALPSSQQQQQQQTQEQGSPPLLDHPSAPSSPDAGDIKPSIQRSSSTPPTMPSSSMLQHLQQHQQMLMNGTPKTPPSESPGSGLHSPNLGLSSSSHPPTATSTPIPSSDGPKTSPFRFDERGPFRFDERVSLGESLIPKGDPMEARLQEMLRYNMDQYASQNLDTLHIARRVRELLSIHNIGQRLFAKYVLGLSQGTVSELLSKPKPWDKLTEKGRDSYRKMHAWACDENAVMLLKSLIPKKGKEGGAGGASLPPFGPGRPGEDNLTEERIALILNEASQAMKSGPVGPGGQGPPNPNVLAAAVAAAAAAAQQQDDSRSNDSRSPASAQEKVVARIYQEELAKLMGRRIEDSLRQQGGPQGGQPPQPGQHFPSLLFPHFFGPGGGGPGQMDRTHDEIRLALDAYHRELAKLNQSALQGGALPPGLLGLPHHPGMPHNGVSPQDLSLPKSERPASASKHSPHHSSSSSSHNGPLSDVDDKAAVAKEISDAAAVADALRHAGSAFSLVRPKTEPGTPGSQQSSSSATTAAAPASTTPAPSPLNSCILPPAGPDDFAASAASPLQRMASITNSLISSPSTPSHHSPAQRPLKAVLPPITQQQFDQFNNLNTEDIVKKVKEQLSQYSISQRLFGESVLGLSQGSVSDLLARPKPWHMLTQKGREPFIRMKMFLEDENAVHKLVASQYKIAPEKLMRTGGYGSINPPASSNKAPKLPDPVAKAMENAAAAAAALGNPALLPGLAPPPPQQTPVSQPSTPGPQLPPPHSAPPTPSPGLLRHPGSPPHDSPSPAGLLKKIPSQQQQQQGLPRAMAAALQHQQQQPSVYEMAALTQDLDTQLITTRIKEALLANNIGQKRSGSRPPGAPPEHAVPTLEKIFGEVVLGLSQGSVSELLSKPKPWHMLSIKGREPFIRMQLWLTDPNNVERLQQMKSERREANKRRRTTTGAGANGPADNSSDTSSNDTAEFYHAPTGSPGPPSAKKQRVLFSEEQKEALRLAFALDPYPNMATIEFLASELNLAARTITNWFHNHRMRLKQTLPHANNNNEPAAQQPPPPSSQQSSTFDPSHFRLLLSQRLTEIHKERGGGAMPPFPFFNPSVAAMVSPSAGPMPPLPPLPPLPPQHLLMAAAMREQLSGLDLTMTSLKKEDSDVDDDSAGDSDDSNLSADFSQHRLPPAPAAAPVRSASRRKPAAPQWVNPEWQEKDKDDAKDSPPAIINGVCVMQTDNYESCLLRRGTAEVDDETVRIEPTAAPEAAQQQQAAKESGASDDEEEAPSTTTLELGVSASAASQASATCQDEAESEDWEQKIDDTAAAATADEQDKRMKVQDDWEF